MRRVLALLILMAVWPATVAAHGILDRTEPRAGGIVKVSPTQIRLWFTGALEPAYSRVHVFDAAGKRVDLGDAAVDPANHALLLVWVSALPPGSYRVVWRVLSVDSHVTQGQFSFRVAP